MGRHRKRRSRSRESQRSKLSSAQRFERRLAMGKVERIPPRRRWVVSDDMEIGEFASTLADLKLDQMLQFEMTHPLARYANVQPYRDN